MEMKGQVSDMTNQITKQREEHDKIQIKVLWFVVSSTLAILSAILVGYITHLFH